MTNDLKPDWLKSKGYIHITAQIDVERRQKEILSKVQNPKFVEQYAFFPLIHATINERRYKRIPGSIIKRAHSYQSDGGEYIKNAKERPLHYATHLDAIIFGCYADKLQNAYEGHIKKFIGLHDCIIAYRKVPIENSETNKGTIHFAYEVFKEIRKRASENNECVVLAFDVKKFFPSLDHKLLKKAWANLFQVEYLPKDHYNVYKAATRFSYIMKDDLRVYGDSDYKRANFNESELARIRNKNGFHALFESPKAFRAKIKSGEIKIYKYPFRNDANEPIGIPQGLPISAVLANIYLFDFDIKILNKLVYEMKCYYRRYSDDIAIVCNVDQKEEVETFITKSIEESLLKISRDKTEKFIFRKVAIGKKEPRLTSVKISNEREQPSTPFIYLGFEFNGQNIHIKSANLAKFYRKMISSIKRKAKRAIKISKENSEQKPIIFRRQLYKLYTSKPVNKTKVHTRWKRFKKNKFGEYRLYTGEKSKLLRSNYLTYVKRASEIMNEPAIEKQIRKHKKIFNEAIFRHLTMKK